MTAKTNGELAAKKKVDVKKLVTLAMIAAIALVIAYFSKMIFGPFAVAGFLKIDLKDFIIVMAGFLYGPLSVVAVSLVVSILEMLLMSTTGIIGCVMNIVSTCAFACVASAIYARRRKMDGAIIGLACGTIVVSAVMMLWNWLITPLYMVNVSREVIATMLLPIFLPFNLVKAVMNSALTLILYRPLITVLGKAHLVPETKSAGKKTKWGIIVVALFLIVTSMLCVLVLSGKI